MLFNRSFQDDILDRLRNEKDDFDGIIISDILSEYSNRRDQIIGLYNRSIFEQSTMPYKQGGVNNDGKFKRSIEYNGIPIYQLILANQNNVNKPIHHDFLGTIKKNFKDYMTGNPVMTMYKSNNESENDLYTEIITDFTKTESLQSKYSKLSGDVALTGVGYMMCYQDGDNLHIKTLQPYEAIVIYDTNGEPQYALRFWDDKEKVVGERNQVEEQDYTYVEWYDKTTVKFFKSSGIVRENKSLGFEPWNRFINGQTISELPHLMDGVPIIEFTKDDSKLGDVEKSLDLQDLYDLLDTGLNNEVLQQAMAYIVMKGLGGADLKEVKREMVDTGIISIDETGAVEYLVKDLNDEALSRSMDRIKRAIYKNSNSIDYDNLDNDTRIMGLEQKLKPIDASVTETIRSWDISINRLWIIITNYWREWENINIDQVNIETVFTKNKPKDVWAEVKAFTESGGRISNETKLELLSFVKDAKSEMLRIDDEDINSPFGDENEQV